MIRLNLTEGYQLKILDNVLDMSNRQKLINKGWKRHSIFIVNESKCRNVFDELPKIIRKQLTISGSLAIVSTYDCAVVNDCFEKEPWVQLLVVTPVVIFDKNYANGKNPRILHFKISKNGTDFDYQANAVGICQINRNNLLTFNPETEWVLLSKYQFELKTWISERYRQETWPDKFNSAIKPSSKKLKSFYKRFNEFISAVYLKLDTYDEKTHEKYIIAVIIAIETGKKRKLTELIRSRKGNTNINIDEVDKIIISEMKTAFGETVSFVVDASNPLNVGIEVCGEDSITLNELRVFSKFSPHYLSEYESNKPIPVDIITRNKR